MTNSNFIPENSLSNPAQPEEAKANSTSFNTKQEYRKPEMRYLSSLDIIQDTKVGWASDGGYNIRR